jgi:hypothetical protein
MSRSSSNLPAPTGGEIILYQTEDGRTRIQCRFENETLWLTQAQIAELFQTTPQNVTLHLKAIFAEGELAEATTCKDYLQVRPEPAQEKPWTQKLWIYDLRTNLHFTLKENTLKRIDLDDFVACYFGGAGADASAPRNRHERKETERFKSFSYDDLTKRDKVNLDIFWLKDDALEESANLPAPEIIAQEITDDLEAALEQFSTITEDLKK